MAAFSSSFQHQHNPNHILLLDSVVLLPNSYPSTINNMHGFSEEPNQPFSQFYQLADLDHSTKVSALSNYYEDSVLYVTNKNTENSSSVEIDHSDEQVSHIDKKRKLRKGYSANSARFKDIREVKRKKPKKVKAREAIEEAQPSYIFVRARRGQATDSHSLAERVRREKINGKMKLLQAIVPGCDKVRGKALMLDEIINYVQSLQNQVQLLSMKLAYSTNPMRYDFGMDFESFMVRPDQNLISLPSPTMQPQRSTTTANDFTGLDNSDNSLLFAHIPNALPLANRQMLLELEDQRQYFNNQSGLDYATVCFH